MKTMMVENIETLCLCGLISDLKKKSFISVSVYAINDFYFKSDINPHVSASNILEHIFTNFMIKIIS